VTRLALNLHHNLPCINRQIGVVETPVKLFLGHRLVCRIMVGRKIIVSESLSGSYPLLGVKDKHAFEKVNS
jgi:hypothetical protein